MLTGHVAAREPFSGRYLEGGEAWQVFKFGPTGSIARSCSWSYCRRISLTAYWLALDLLDCLGVRWYAPHHVRHLRTGIIRASSSCKESAIPSKEHRKEIPHKIRKNVSNAVKKDSGQLLEATEIARDQTHHRGDVFLDGV